ncbi:hypothetical protein PTKIN_Ptkin10aG0107700 [Pterospermum kingtungense]
MAAFTPISLSKDPALSNGTLTIFGSSVKTGETQQTQSKTGVKLRALAEPPPLQELKGSKEESMVDIGSGCNLFDEMKSRENLKHFQALSKGQAPKVMMFFIFQ